MKFRSKIGLWFYIMLALTMIMPIVMAIWFIGLGIVAEAIALFIFFLIINAVLVIPILINTCYIFEERVLCIKCGFFKPTRIPYTTIKKIEETRNPFASAALSLDRIEITFKGDSVLVSPVNKHDFLQQIKLRIDAAKEGAST